MFISAKVFFEDNSASNRLLIKQAETAIPQEFVKLFKKNVTEITPKKTGALRRSIITQSMGNRAQIGWRAPYALAQEEGGHTQFHYVKGENQRDGGYGTIKPDTYRYKHYTTEGTGPHFARTAFRVTREQMPRVMRELRLTK